MVISKKVILTGSFGVGKTSLFNRFIHDTFGDKYLTTIGVKVSKKVVEIDGRELSLLIWDIAGEVTQDKVPVSYFLGASGIVYVFDLTRPSTYKNIEGDLNYLRKILPEGVFRVAGNKRDLLSPEDMQLVLDNLPVPCNLTTSAKTGEHVEELFLGMGAELLANNNN